MLARNEEGNPVLLKNKYGNGTIYFVNFSPENIAYDDPGSFERYQYHKIYEAVAGDIAKNKPVISKNPNVFTTVNPEDENTAIVTVLNYADKDLAFEATISDAWEISEVLYGSLDKLPACDGAILRVKKK